MLDLLGFLLFAVGLAFEIIRNHQLEGFRADLNNRGQVLTSGRWYYTRHPNYFGDAARVAHLPESHAHDAIANSRVWHDAARGTPESLKASRLVYIACTPACFPWFPSR